MPSSAHVRIPATSEDSPFAWTKHVRVPRILVEFRPVDSPHSIFDAIYAELIGPYPDDRAKSLVGVVSCTVLAVVPFVDDGPDVRERRCEMAVWDFGQWREVSELYSLQYPQRSDAESSG